MMADMKLTNAMRDEWSVFDEHGRAVATKVSLARADELLFKTQAEENRKARLEEHKGERG